MTNKKKGYQKPALDVIKMRSLPCLNDDSVPAGGDDHPARQNDMDDY